MLRQFLQVNSTLFLATLCICTDEDAIEDTTEDTTEYNIDYIIEDTIDGHF